MLILGLESSCDETAGALLRDGRDCLGQFVASQTDLHRAYGGVIPELAARAHMECLLPGLENLFRETGAVPADLDAVAVTHRPGLIGALLVGLTAAKALALAWNKPLIGVDHIEAHVAAARLAVPELSAPYVALVASGGHTHLYAVDRDPAPRGGMREIGHTLDDAAGEAFDKAAKLLGLGFPGGPRLEAAARDGNPAAFDWERMALPPDGINFSFSGLKTAVWRAARGPGAARASPLRLGAADVRNAAAAFQQAVTRALVERTVAAAKRTGAGWIAVGGGVAANGALRRRLTEIAETHGFRVALPPPALCTDNGLMVAARACELWRAGIRDDLDLDAFAR